MATAAKLQVASTSYSINSNGRRSKSPSPAYKSYCCCICTKSNGSLFPAHSSISQDTRSPSPIEDYHRSRRSTIIEQQMSLKLTLCSVLIWFIQYLIYGSLCSICPMFDSNIVELGITAAIFPLISVLLTPIVRRLSLINTIGVIRCITWGLALQSLFCVLFGVGPYMMDRSISDFMSTPHLFFIASTVTRGLIATLSVFIELSILSINHQLKPRPLLRRPQLLPLFGGIGLVSSPCVTGYLYLFGYNIDSTATDTNRADFGYLMAFCGIGTLIMFSTVIIRYLMGSIHLKRPSPQPISPCIPILRNFNVVYSSFIGITAMIILTFVLVSLPFYLKDVDGQYLDVRGGKDESDEMTRITTYFLILGAPFIVCSFVASHLVHKLCGSLTTMLYGLFGMSIGLLILSTEHPFHYVVADALKMPPEPVFVGLPLIGASAAFTITPYLLYLSKALSLSFRDQSTGIAFNVHRFTMNVAKCIGPVLGTCIYSFAGSVAVSETLLMMSLCSLTLSIMGVLMLKCLRWKRVTFDSKRAPLLHHNGHCDEHNEHSVTISKIDLMQRSMSGSPPSTYDQIRYRPILQDDKSCGCLCSKTSCFFSFGALCDDRKHRAHSISGSFTQRNGREKVRCSIMDSGNPNGDRTGSPLRAINNKARRSFMGGPKYSIASDDGKTASPLLAQSWNTLLRGANGHDPNHSLLNIPGSQSLLEQDSEEHSVVSTSNRKPREKSRVLDNGKEMSMTEDTQFDSEHPAFGGSAIINRNDSASPSPFVRPQNGYSGPQIMRRAGMPGYAGLRNRNISESQNSMTTDKESQTFLLLSDEDFASIREDDEDIYNAPEMESYRH